MQKHSSLLYKSTLLLLGFFLSLSNLKADPLKNPDFLKQTSESFRSVAKKVSPSVVVIETVREAPKAHPLHFAPNGGGGQEFPFGDFFEQFGGGFPDSKRSPDKAAGSGFVIDKQGIIVTNNHVIDGASTIKVILPSDEKNPIVAKVIGHDAKTDLAVLKIETKKELTPINWGNSDAVEVGDWSVAIGSPFMLSHSVTAGIISAKGRNASQLMGTDYGYELLQTDAAINPGNSGGPLCDLEGNVVGVNVAIYSNNGGYMGIGFAIPSKVAQQVVNQLKNEGKVTRGWLGVLIQEATPELLKELGVKNGVVIAEVQEESPALKAGLTAGDLVMEVAGKTIETSSGLQQAITEKKPGESVPLKVVSYQTKKTKTISVKLGELPGSTSPLASNEKNSRVDALGMELSPSQKGLEVVRVLPGSKAALSGLKPGDRIKSAGRKQVHSVSEFQNLVDKGKSIGLVVERDKRELFLVLNS